MNTRHTWMLGLAALGLALATSAQANPQGRYERNGLDGSFMLAKRDSRDDVREEPRTSDKDARSSKREAERDEPPGYGYGYERRQQHDKPERKDDTPRQPRR